MKFTKITLLLLFLVASGSFLSAQSTYHILTHQPYTPCVGSPVLFQANDTSGLFQNAWMQWGFGDGSYASANSTNPYASHVYSTPGTYWIDYYAWDSVSMTQDSNYYQIVVDSVCSNHDLITGLAYYDTDGNGTQDPGEVPLPNQFIQITPGPYTFTTDQNGAYGINLPPGTYTFTALPQTYFNVTEPLAGSYTIVSTGTAQTHSGNDFGLHPTAGINDLKVSAYSIPPVPGFNRVYTLNYNNVGTTILNSNITFQYDSQLSYIGASNSGTNSGNTVTWNLGNLLPGASGLVRCTLGVSQSQTVGTVLNSIATINPVTGDTTPGNNVDSLAQEVLASYDPNDKSVSPPGQGPSGDINPGTELTYRIRFQNTGNFYATHVTLKDTLDADFDWTTLEVLGASHPMTWYLNNGELVFRFENIYLPDSTTNEPGSHGWAQYRITPKSSAPLGTELTNSASIYFDFNPPILTNTTLNTLSLTIAVDPAYSQVEMSIAPHPFSTQAMVRFDNPDKMSHNFVLRDIQGKVVREVRNIEGGNFQLERNNLPAGIYLFMLSNENGVAATGKVVVQ